MKGCLGLIFKIIILVLVIAGLQQLGIIDFVKNKVDDYNGTKNERITEKNKDILDLSQIDEEYDLNKNLNFMNNRMITAEHRATGQKMIMIEMSKSDLLTRDDIKGDGLEEKINDIFNKSQNKFLKFDKPQIIKKGEFYGIGQKIPYAKFKSGFSLPLKEIEGIIGVATLKDGKNLTVISYNQDGKYSQIITDAFYNKVK